MIWEIRLHGRGGQGAVIASKILAVAAFEANLHVQSFPFFGSERRGAPVAAFVRLSDSPIRVRCEIREPDGLVVLDSNLLSLGLVDITQGLKEDGWILMNSPLPPEAFHKLGRPVATVDATRIALKHKLGSPSSPIVNTAILGAFSRFPTIVPIETIVKTIEKEVPAHSKENAQAALDAYEQVIIPEGVMVDSIPSENTSSHAAMLKRFER